MACNEKTCTEVRYSFSITLGPATLVEGSCEEKPDPNGVEQIQQQMMEGLRRDFPDIEPACAEGCTCELDATHTTKFTRTLPARRYTVQALDQPVTPGGCVYQVSATVEITRTRREGRCERGEIAMTEQKAR